MRKHGAEAAIDLMPQQLAGGVRIEDLDEELDPDDLTGEEMETLEACNAAVLGINPGTLDDHQRYQAQLGLTFPLLHDPGAQVAALYGARQEDGSVRRMVYLIDTQGMIRYGRLGMHWNEAFLSALSALA